MSNQQPPDCKACAHCYMELSDWNFICGHPESGTFGKYLHNGIPEHCGEQKTNFEQHPGRGVDGSLG